MPPIQDRDQGYAALVERVYGARRPKVSVGIFEAEGAKPHSGGKTILEIAQINEFGLGVPERSFIRAWADANQSRARQMIGALMKAVIQGKYTAAQALELFGQRVQAEIQLRIAEGIDPPNAPSTIKNKGSSVPLIEDGILRSSVTYKVDPG